MGVIISVLTLVFLLFTTRSDAEPRMILVGGSAGSWKVPDSSSNTLNHWAENNRFRVGDILVWKYDMKVDSVLQVSKEDYESCNTLRPMKAYNNGDTKVELDRSGPYYFISGNSGNCFRGEKITLVVLSERKPGGGPSGGESPKVSPSVVTPAPAPAPAAEHNAGVGLNVGNGLLLTVAVVMGLAMA